RHPCGFRVCVIRRRRRRRSTLFPYTTLFRSGGAAWEREARSALEGAAPASAGSPTATPRGKGVPLIARAPSERAGRAHQRRPRADRKSTRLNSSHVKNSYAVFCLKKKKSKKQ